MKSKYFCMPLQCLSFPLRLMVSVASEVFFSLMKVAILGSGISALAAAYYLSLRKSFKIIMIQGPMKGGWIETNKSMKTGALLEAGPRSLRHNGAAGLNTLKLVRGVN